MKSVPAGGRASQQASENLPDCTGENGAETETDRTVTETTRAAGLLIAHASPQHPKGSLRGYREPPGLFMWPSSQYAPFG